MKKILTLGIVALVLITMSSCQFNLFAEFDRIEIPSVSELNANASSDEEGFVSDVEDYVENDFLENADVSDEQIEAIVSNLETIYGGSGSTETVQQAAVLAGAIIINRDPATSSVVNGVVETVTEFIDSGDTIDLETIVVNVFPDNLDLTGLQNILDDLDRAALAYADFSATLGSGADWMSSGEIGDMAQFAVVSLAISDLRDQLINSGTYPTADDADQDLLDFIASEGSDSLDAALLITNPFDTGDGSSTYETELQDILNFADLPL